jgi:peptidoglycan/LPS O-acetylase OafA/YrhL
MSGAGASASRSGENRVLNLLRSLSAFVVVLGHVRLLFVEDYSSAPHTPIGAMLYAFTSLGSQAVIVFFVLSGYFVGGGVVSRFRRSAFSWFDYGNSRLTRLWLVLIPALLLTLVCDLAGAELFPASAVYLSPDRYVGMNRDPTLDPVTFLGNLAFLQGLHVPIYGTDNPLWSLAYEAWYYVMFPAILALTWRGQSVRNRVVGALLLVIGAFVSGPSVLLLFPCWLAGALVGAYRRQLARLLARARRRPLAVVRGLAVVATLLVAVLVRLQPELPWRSETWLLAAVTAGMIAAFVTDVEWHGRFGQTLGIVGRTAHSSYSLYAVHMPIVVILAAWILPDPNRRVPMTPLTLLMCVGLVIGIWVIAYGFARVTEMQTDRVKAAIERFWRAGGNRSVAHGSEGTR